MRSRKRQRLHLPTCSLLGTARHLGLCPSSLELAVILRPFSTWFKLGAMSENAVWEVISGKDTWPDSSHPFALFLFCGVSSVFPFSASKVRSIEPSFPLLPVFTWQDKGGIMVREGRSIRSKECGRLSFAAFVEELELVGAMAFHGFKVVQDFVHPQWCIF